MQLIKLDGDFSVCQLAAVAGIDLGLQYSFLSVTDDEISYVCRSEFVPREVLKEEGGWKALKINGTMEFSLIGVIAGISGLLAERKISIFVISTFNTDYILVKADNFDQTLDVLRSREYEIVPPPAG